MMMMMMPPCIQQGVSWHGGWASATVTAPHPCIQQGVSWHGGWAPPTVTDPHPCIQQGVSCQGVEPLLVWQPDPLHTSLCELTGVESPGTVTARSLAYSIVWVDRGWVPCYSDSPSPLHTSVCELTGVSLTPCIYLNVVRYSSPYCTMFITAILFTANMYRCRFVPRVGSGAL